MKRNIVLASCLMLTACGPSPGADGYRFGEAEFERETVQVTLVQYDRQADFITAARANGAYREGLEAFALLEANSPACEIHIMRIATNYRPEWLGHEMTHCIHGRWHK